MNAKEEMWERVQKIVQEFDKINEWLEKFIWSVAEVHDPANFNQALGLLMAQAAWEAHRSLENATRSPDAESMMCELKDARVYLQSVLTVDRELRFLRDEEVEKFEEAVKIVEEAIRLLQALEVLER